VAGAEAYLRAKFYLDPFNHLARIHQRFRQDRQARQDRTTVRYHRANRFTNGRPKTKFSGVMVLQGVEFSIFLLIFEWTLQKCSATALPVICTWTELLHNENKWLLERCNPWRHVANRHMSISQLLSSSCYLFTLSNSGLLSLQWPRPASHAHRHRHISVTDTLTHDQLIASRQQYQS